MSRKIERVEYIDIEIMKVLKKYFKNFIMIESFIF